MRASDRTPKTWTFVGDVGGWSSYHVGDEAMLAANLDLFRALTPRATLTVVSADPAFTSAEYGVRAVPRLGFDPCTTEEQREALLTRLSARTWPSDGAPAAFRSLSGPSDGLVISGGGNLTSTWPGCIYERVALCRRAAANGAPVIMLGQTLGPALAAPHRTLVAELVDTASWIGVRDEPSFALAVELGAQPSRLSYQLDDAASLGGGGAAPALPFPAREPWIAVTIHPVADPAGSDPLLDALAEQLTAIASQTGCHLAFIPHAQASPAMGAPWSDEEVGQALARRMPRAALHVLPIMRARQVAVLTGQARMIVSSRYHALVFGLAAGTPCLGLFGCEYTKVKVLGALSHYGRAADSCSLGEVGRGVLLDRATSLWEGREAASQVLRAHALVSDREERRRRRQLSAFVAGRAFDRSDRRATGQARTPTMDTSPQQDRLELADLREENRRLRAAVTQMRAEILTLHRRLDLLPPPGPEPQPAAPPTGATAHDWEVMRGDLQRLNAHAIDLARRLNATHGSRSWRVTRPIREVAHALRRLRPGASGEPEA